MLNKLHSEYGNRYIFLELWAIEDWQRIEKENS